MTYREERDDFMARMGAEKIPVSVARALLREATTLQKLAELECSSEAADRDRVPCPKRYQTAQGCLCDDYGSKDGEAHGMVPRIAVREAMVKRRVTALCRERGLTPHFGGDPRGAVLVIGVPSGASTSWGGEGLAVPAQGFTVAQMDRITRAR